MMGLRQNNLSASPAKIGSIRGINTCLVPLSVQAATQCHQYIRCHHSLFPPSQRQPGCDRTNEPEKGVNMVQRSASLRTDIKSGIWLVNQLAGFVISTLLIMTLPTIAQSFTLGPFTITRTLGDHSISFPATVTVVCGANGVGAAVTARVNLQALADEKTRENMMTVTGATAPRIEKPVRDFKYHGTLFNIDGDRLRAKYHFEARIKPLPRTNASVETWLRLSVENGSLVGRAENAKLNVSKGVYKGIVEILGVRDDINAFLGATLNAWLKKDEARIELPQEVQNLGVTMTAARILGEGDAMFLVVDGLISPGLPLTLIGCPGA
jgi:hypothetical protein